MHAENNASVSNYQILMGRKRGKGESDRPPCRAGNTSPLPLPKSSLYLLYSHLEGPSSLYKIDLQQHDGVPATVLFPTFQEFTYNHCSRMKCALLGSKLYYLGGQHLIDKDHDQMPHYDKIFPRQVYEIDTTANGPLKKKEVGSLNTGKPDPCVFAAAGKIYALCSRMTEQSLPGPLTRKLFELTKELMLFECFDPTTKQSQQLPDPPVSGRVRWTGCNVLEHRKQVVLSAKEIHKGSTTVLVYHLELNMWDYYDDPSPYKIMTALSLQEGDRHAHLYGLPANRAPVKTEFNLNLDTMLRKPNSRSYHFCDDDDDDGLVEMSLMGNVNRQWVHYSFIHRHYFDYFNTARRFLCYLGDGYFCYIESGLLRGDDLYTRGVSVTLCKDVSDDDDGSTTSSKSGGGEYFKAKMLNSWKIVLKTPLVESMAKLEKCFVV